jgi:hypothetical protein
MADRMRVTSFMNGTETGNSQTGTTKPAHGARRGIIDEPARFPT